LKLLLDTHIWLWSLREPRRLSRLVLQELKSASNEVWLSPISTWEALLLRAKGRIVIDDVEELLASSSKELREAPLTHEIVIAAARLPLAHADPADRFLAATAEVLGLTLVTADQRLLGLGKIATLANR
jgi:PIN domain nuclease of toxin-antitoxin system